MTHVVVIGGGVMGSSAAWHLASRGHEVTLLEQFEPGHSRGSSHGSSRIFRLAYPQEAYVRLAARALPLWRRLEEQTGTPVLTLTGAVDHGPAGLIAELAAALRATGHASETLGAAQAQSRWPAMRFDTSALFHAEAGRVHADHAVAAFHTAAREQGAQLRFGVRVDDVRPQGAERVEVICAGETIVADAAVVAVGGWATMLRDVVPGLPQLRVTREQPVHFPGPDPLSWPSFIHHGGGPTTPGAGPSTVYGLGSVDGVKVGLHGVGPAVDPDAPNRAIDPAALARVQDYARRWLPGLDADRPEPTTCLYTLTPDEDFVVDRSGPITVLAGFSGHGFKFASVIGELAADLVEGGTAQPEFRLGR